MIRDAIKKLISGNDLTIDEMDEAFRQITSGEATEAQIGSFITALRMKGETVDEITAAAKVMREKSVHISALKNAIDIDSANDLVVDTCGTGGTGINTFNISTAASFVAAGSGVKVAKHGNRASSSRSGSADVMEALGVRIDIPADMVQSCILECGIGFLYAPLFHESMKYASKSRKDIGIRTIFNLLGPLSNPAGASCQILGVYDPSLTEILARVVKNLGLRHAMVVHGAGNIDEITITGKTRISELFNGRVRTYSVTPEKFGMKRASLDDIEGGNARENADIVLSILKGEISPRRDIVLLNAGAAIYVSGRARTIKAGIISARESIDSGRAIEKLIKLIEITNR